MSIKFNKLLFSITLISVLVFSSCSQRLGWGVLLWSTDEPPVLSGTVLPVYIRSNIEQVWVVGIPETLIRDKNDTDKMEIPLDRLAFVGSKKKAILWAEDFAEYAHIYAENLQDGLPIRDHPDNNSRRVYRLRLGEIIKVLSKVQGVPPISASGDPLEGEWYKVLTRDGVTGYCFSYRLRAFNYSEWQPQSADIVQNEAVHDPDLDMIMSRRWSPESYLQMINSRQINISELERHYRFDPGQDTGIAKIILPDVEREIVYEGIYPDGERTWRFEGSSLQMSLRSNTSLAVQVTENTGVRRTFNFVALSSDVNDLIVQENARREGQFSEIFNQGPVFTSNNYGTITFTQTGGFVWTGFDLLVPQLIPEDARGEGRVYMDIFLASSIIDRYTGAATFRFADVNINLRFMYSLDNQGMRLEVAPNNTIENSTVMRRSPSPMVLYFFKDSSY